MKKRLKKLDIDEEVEKKKQYPLFSFKHLQTNISYKDCKETKFFIDFIGRLQKLSELGWEEIRKFATTQFWNGENTRKKYQYIVEEKDGKYIAQLTIEN